MTQPLLRFLTACAQGCYKHYVQGLGWVCCRCGN
jgi:hypothetical protein